MKRTFILRTGITCAALLFVAAPTRAADETAPPAAALDSKPSLSGTSARRAHWQERLTLGPGDVLSISMLDTPDSARNEVLVGPDGRINYFEVQNLMATGLTVDEFRARLDYELSKFYRAPRSVVTPVTYRSKKYFVLGAVQRKGVFTLDRPTTVIEAVALAGGLESGVIQRNPVELADLTHSFLVRDGKRLPVDFEKLFQRGDLTQNVPLEPNDYLFFPPANLNEVYVLGEVLTPGPQPWDAATTVISAITRHGSFTPTAYRQKVLVVRGSINSPQTFVVNTAAILSAGQPDFKLQPGDIVYVNSKPWSAAQQLLEGAMASFVQAALVTYTGQYIGPFIQKPLIKP